MVRRNFTNQNVLSIDIQDEIWESEKKKAVTKALKPMIYISLFHDVCCFSFVLSQTSGTLINFIEKCTNIYNSKLVKWDPQLN